MRITQHGKWIARNDIDSALMGHPPGVLILVREGDARDWYEHQTQFERDTIKASVVEGRIINACVDVSMICPAGHSLIEIHDTTGDPRSYIGVVYDETTNSLGEKT